MKTPTERYTEAQLVLVRNGAHTGLLKHADATDASIMLCRTRKYGDSSPSPVEIQKNVNRLWGIKP